MLTAAVENHPLPGHRLAGKMLLMSGFAACNIAVPKAGQAQRVAPRLVLVHKVPEA